MNMTTEEYIKKMNEYDTAIAISLSKNNELEATRLQIEKKKLFMEYRKAAIEKYGKNASLD